MLTGVILAGGKHDMLAGKHKLLLSVSGQKVIQRQYNEMKKICKEIIIVTNNPHDLLTIVPPDTRIICDYYRNVGPLGGIHAGMSLAKYPFIWVVSCAMPFINASAANLMLNVLYTPNYDAVIPKIGNQYIPYHGIYHKNALHLINTLIKNRNTSIHNFLNMLNFLPIEESDLLAQHVNTDFRYAIKTKKDYLNVKEITLDKV